MRIRKIINLGILFGYDTKFSGLSQQRNVWSSVRRIDFQILGVEGLKKLVRIRGGGGGGGGLLQFTC